MLTGILIALVVILSIYILYKSDPTVNNEVGKVINEAANQVKKIEKDITPVK